jgi:hypothetical protein
MKINVGFLAVLFLALAGATAQASEITYTVNETITGPVNGVAGNPIQTDSVVGTITTDGTIGVLQTSDILSWNLDLIDVTNPQYSDLLTTSNSSFSASGNVLSATDAGLYFNFNGSGIAAFQDNNPGPSSGYHYWCLNATSYACALGNTIAPDNVYSWDLGNGDDLVIAASGTQGQVGNSPLNQGGEAAETPEPSSLLLLGSGLVGLAGMVRRKIGLRA